MSNAIRPTLIGVTALMASAWAMPAQAHITMVGDILSRGGDQKMSPCDGAKGDGPSYTFQPGATITLKLKETIPHPSYFRISFDADGDDAFVEPKSIKPIDPTRACPYDADDQCGDADYCNGDAVLWDNLNPHLAADAKDMSWNIKLPDVECEHCTIQVIQVMEDTVHGAYCPQGSCANAKGSLEDIYHRCIDITLKKDATNSPGATTDTVDNQGTNCLTGETTAPKPAAAGSGTGGTGGSSGAAAKPATNTAGGAAVSASSDSDKSDTDSSAKADSDSGCSVANAGASSHASLAWLAVLGGVLGASRLRRRRA